MGSSFTGFADDFDKAFRWAVGLAEQGKRGRFATYNRVIKAIEGGTFNKLRAPDRDPEVVFNALHAGMELSTIYEGFAEEDNPELRARMKDYVRGPITEAKEKPDASSNLARNRGLELFVGALFRLASFECTLPSDGDLWVQHPGIAIECKRMQSEKQVGKNYSKGVSQLEDRTAARGQPAFGLVAIDVGKLIHGGKRILRTASDAAATKLMDESLTAARAKFASVWKNGTSEHCHAVIVLMTVPIEIPSANTYLRGHHMHMLILSDVVDDAARGLLHIIKGEMEKRTGVSPYR